MDRLRTPFLIAALALAIIVVALDLGDASRLGFLDDMPELGQPDYIETLSDSMDWLPEPWRGDVESKLDEARKEGSSTSDTLARLGTIESPGLGIRYLALVDAVVLFTTVLVCAGVLVPRYVQGKTQGIVTLIFALLLIIGAISLVLLVAVPKLILMISLLLAAPFGTLAYLAVYGHFPRSTAAAALSALFLLKVLFGASLILAHQRFVQNKGLVLLVITALVATIIVTFLHAIVPIILVSITDAIAAIVVAVIAAIWGIALLVGGLLSVVKTVS